MKYSPKQYEYRMVKIKNNIPGDTRDLEHRETNSYVVFSGHWGTLSDRTLVYDLGVAEDDLELVKQHLEEVPLPSLVDREFLYHPELIL